MPQTNKSAQELTTSWSDPLATPSPTTLPSELADHPRYRLVELLGEGGMGRVYKAEHRLMNRWVAIKVVRDALLDKPAVRERFVRELRTSAQLTHPNIVVAHDAEQAGAVCFLVMEYIAGESLSAVVKRRGSLPVAEACGYVRQAAMGLRHAHERGLVHRDIKPGNLMLTAEGIVKVLDFGLARFTLERAAEQASSSRAPLSPSPVAEAAAEQTVSEAGMGTPSSLPAGQGQPAEHTASGAVLGTPSYMAPEQARNARAADIRSDIYSLGCTLSYLLFGKPMQPGGATSHVPDDLARVLARMQAPDPARRYQTPVEVAEALTTFCQPASEKVKPAARRMRFALAASLLIAFGVAVPLAIRSFSGQEENERPTPSDKQDQTKDVARIDVPKDGSAKIVPATDKPGEQPRVTGQGSTLVSLQVAPNPPVRGQPVKLTATILPSNPPDGQPGGGATFYDGETKLGYAGMEGVQATFTVNELKPGEHSLRVAYDGDANYRRCFSAPTIVTVPP